MNYLLLLTPDRWKRLIGDSDLPDLLPLCAVPGTLAPVFVTALSFSAAAQETATVVPVYYRHCC